MWVPAGEAAEHDPLLAVPHPEFVPVIFAADWAEADGYRVLLETANIPALIEASDGDAMLALGANGSVPVLVPEQLHDEASEIVAGVEASCPTDFDEGGDPDDDEDDDLDHDDLDDDDDFLDDDDDDDDLV